MPDAQQRGSALADARKDPAEAQSLSEAESSSSASFADETDEQRIALLTERCRELEAQLRQAQKFQTLGVIASGIAHDFNNLLTGIVGYAEILKTDLGATNVPEGVLESLEMIEAAANQATRLTTQMLMLARGGQSQRVAVDIHQVLRQTKELLTAGNGKMFRTELHLHPGVVQVQGEPTQLFQVFLNLGLNARDAVARGGAIVFRTEVAQAAKQVRVTVADDGVGIPEDLQARVFEPFFTTKESAQGTGMGLAVVRRIVDEHGGRIELASAPGQGTTFSVFLPLVAQSSARA